MKKILLLTVVMLCAGCVTVKIPKYLRDEFPYKKKFYSNFEEAFSATQKALEELGWRITETAYPAVFEAGASPQEAKGKEILIFTEIRQTPLIVSSRYMSLNVYVREADHSTDVEIRYISVVPILFKSAQNYKNDVVVYKIFDRISELLEK